jgi:hypothetical protein
MNKSIFLLLAIASKLHTGQARILFGKHDDGRRARGKGQARAADQPETVVRAVPNFKGKTVGPRPTRHRGAIFYLPVIINICVIVTAMNFVGTPIVACLMLVGNLYLFVWDYPRTKAFLNAILVK